jgi:hypothetical protein
VALAVCAALAATKGRSSVFVGDDISDKKAANARAACFIPPEEEIVALVDTTAFGSAKHCWAFTDRALRYCGSMGCHVVEYRYFAARSFARGRFGSVQVRGPDGTVIVLTDNGGSVEDRIAMLEAVRAAVCGGPAGNTAQAGAGPLAAAA